VAKWQTRRIQNPLLATECWFESGQGHHSKLRELPLTSIKIPKKQVLIAISAADLSMVVRWHFAKFWSIFLKLLAFSTDRSGNLRGKCQQ
jgi:hypothetical protein